jgi:uncharacterized RDD family membrane protein YckC
MLATELSTGRTLAMRRYAALVVDYVVILAYMGTLRLVLFVAPQIRTWFNRPSTAHIAAFFLLTVPVSAYFVLLEASPSRATFGKRLTHIRVESFDGGTLTPGHSIVRTVVKFIPWELSHAAIWRIRFGVDHSTAVWLLVAAWGFVVATLVCVSLDRHQRAIHDFMAGSVVVITPLRDRTH